MELRDLQQYCEPQWQAIRTHPFVQGMGRGQLADEQLCYFIAQDTLYLRDFYWVLAMAAGRWGERGPAETLLKHAATVFQVEKSLHEQIAHHFGSTPEDLQKTPRGIITKAYGDHLVRTAYTEPLSVLVAAVLPCYWTYQAIGMEFRDGLPEHALMREWLLTYDGPIYRHAVQEVVALFESLSIQRSEMDGVRLAFHGSMEYERLFWEQAWRQGMLGLPLSS